MAKQGGLEDHVERFPQTTKTWDGEVGELWMVEPDQRELSRYHGSSCERQQAGRSDRVTRLRRPRRSTCLPGCGSPGSGAALAGFYTNEAREFADGKRTVLEIRDAISAEFGPVETSEVLEYFRSQSAMFDLKAK